MSFGNSTTTGSIFLQKSYRRLGVRAGKLASRSVFNAKRFQRRLERSIQTSIAAWLWLRRHDYDVIHVIHGRLQAFPAVMAGRWLGKPVVVKIGRGGEDYFVLSTVQRKRLFGSYFARRIAPSHDRMGGQQSGNRGRPADWGIPDGWVHAIPNCVAVPENVDLCGKDGTIRFARMGRLDVEKAIDQMIRSFATLTENAPARLIILGDGPCREELAALARELGQERRIFFPGAVDDVTPFLRNADFYLSTSLSEGMSNALLEARSFAVPPVVSKVSGAGDLVEDGVSGLFFPPGDEAALVARLKNALAMPTERSRAMGRAAYDAIKRKFSLNLIVERHLALYRALLTHGMERHEA